MQASVGAPLSLTIWITDDSVREKEPVRGQGSDAEAKARDERDLVQALRSGSGHLQSSRSSRSRQLKGTATTSATFKQPGDYVIRVRADNFGRVDTSAGNQCCWTNGYVKVTVTP